MRYKVETKITERGEIYCVADSPEEAWDYVEDMLDGIYSGKKNVHIEVTDVKETEE